MQVSYPAFLDSTIFVGFKDVFKNRFIKIINKKVLTLLQLGAIMHHAKRSDRIKLLANFYNMSITKLMVELLVIGYIDMLDARNK